MKIMVTGHLGMLGKEVHQAVERMGHSAMIEDVDITKEILVKDCCPEVVINCAGLVPQRDPPPTPAEMMRVNGYGPWNLADWCDQIEARLIHVSTDCVFDGAGAGPHYEDKPLRPMTVYGRSKAAGEILGKPHLTVRTSFVGFGKYGLIEELRQCGVGDKVYEASDMLLWTGQTTRYVAETLIILAEREVDGILHIPGDSLTRLELVALLQNVLDLEFTFTRIHLPEIDRRLDSKKWEDLWLPELPSFEWQLEWLRRSQ